MLQKLQTKKKAGNLFNICKEIKFEPTQYLIKSKNSEKTAEDLQSLDLVLSSL